MGINARGQWEVANDQEDPSYVSGLWYYFQEGFIQAGQALGANTIRFVPFRVRQLVNIAQIGTRIATLAAGGNIQLGIYNANPNTLAPTGQVLARTASLPTDTATVVAGALFPGIVVPGASSMPALQLQRGIYHFAINADAGAGGTCVCAVLGASATYPGNLVGASTQAILNQSAVNCSFSRAFGSTFGTWPDMTSQAAGDSASTNHALGMFQVQ